MLFWLSPVNVESYDLFSSMINHTCLIAPAFNPVLAMVSVFVGEGEAPTEVVDNRGPAAASKPTAANTTAVFRTRRPDLRNLIMA